MHNTCFICEREKEQSYMCGDCYEKEIERVRAISNKQRAALVACVDWLDNAPIDYSNGVTHNGIDEGNILGWKAHNEITKAAKRAMEQTP